MGKLTTHVLDSAQGRPAVNVVIELWRVHASGERQLIKTVRTNADGRTDPPLLVDDEFAVAQYELVFAVGDYFAEQPIATTTPPFLNHVPLRFTIADADAHYHVPLLVSPWSYTTYRGS